MKISANGLAIVKAFEGCHKAVKGKPGHFVAYLDPVGVLTIGYGHTNHHAPKINRDTVWTQAACDAVLQSDMATFERHVSDLAHVKLTQNEFDALVSWAFNTGGPSSATLWKKLRVGKKSEIPAELKKWTKAGGKTLAGLVRRRDSEAALFQGKVAEAFRIAGIRGKPQAVDAMPGQVPPPPDIPKPVYPQPSILGRFFSALLSIFRK